jgi:hypothetical protein
MKKFLFFLFLLIVLAGTVFFLGWAQLTVPPGSYGVMRSKTHGLETEVIRDGEFRWFWYKIIPTNAKVSVYTISPVKRSIKTSGVLASGDVYAALAGLNADFSWEISGDISFSLKPEKLPEFTDKENINDDEGLRTAEELLAAKIETLVLQRLRNYANNANGEEINAIAFAVSNPQINSEIQSLVPEIENLNCTIQFVRIPDYALYQALFSLYKEYLARQNAVLSLGVADEAERRINLRTRMEELTQYGELLTKYPILIQYLNMEKNNQNGDVQNGN